MLKWTVTKRPEGGTAAAAVQRQRQNGTSNGQRPQHARRSLGALSERNIYSDNITAASKVKARRSLGATMHRHANNVDKENQCVTSTPHPVVGSRTSASPYSMALRDVSNITPNSTPRRLSTTPQQGRKRTLPVSPTAAVTSTAKKESNLPYASTLPTFDIEYSPCGVKNVPFLALRGLGLTDSYFETPGRYFQEDQKPPAAKRPKPFVAPAPPAEKSEPSLTPLSSRLSELRFSKISFKRNAEPKTVNNNNNKIFNDDEPSLNSSEMGDITLDKMIDAILESAKKDKLTATTAATATVTSRPKRSSSQKSKQSKIFSPTYTPADDPASDLYPTDVLLDQLPPKLIEHAETTIILEETTHVNEREVKTPEPIAKSQAKSLRQSLTRFVLASPLDACNLRRQKAVRRKNKADAALVEKEPAEKKPCRIGLTLPNGIPSPETPKTASYNQSKLEQLAQMQTPTEIAIVVDSDPPNTATKSNQLKLSTIDEMTPSIRSVDLQGTSTPTGVETLSLEKTRKCLAFSPTLGEDSLEKRHSVASSTTSRCSRVTIVKGSLDVQLQVEEAPSGSKLHVHVIRCKDLQRLGGNTINAYVKVAVVNPVNPEKDQGFQRTAVHRNSSRPLFDHRFVFELGSPNAITDEEDLRRVQLAVWHRDRECKRSEFLGCMSFPLKNVFKQEINGSFKLQPQSCLTNPTPPIPDLGENSHCSVDVSMEESTATVAATAGISSNASEPNSLSKKALHQRDADENLFLRMLELDPPLENRPYPGRTPFTITKQLTRVADKGFGFSVVWTHPPRVEKVEPELSADQAGILPGDYVVFVDKHNVVTMPELDVLNLIKIQGDTLLLEIYRRPLRPVIGPPSFTPYSVPIHPPDQQDEESLPKPPMTPIRLSTACSNTILTETAKRRLNLPQVTFTKEVGKGVLV